MGTVLFCLLQLKHRSVAHRDWPEIGDKMECFFMCGCIKGVTRDPIDDTQSITWEGERSFADRHCFKVWKAKYAHLYTAREDFRKAMVKDKALDYVYLGVCRLGMSVWLGTAMPQDAYTWTCATTHCHV